MKAQRISQLELAACLLIRLAELHVVVRSEEGTYLATPTQNVVGSSLETYNIIAALNGEKAAIETLLRDLL